MGHEPRAAWAWQLFTRLGEAQILLPALLLLGVALLRQPAGRPLALCWAGALAAAALLTLASKLAFIGWGIGWPALDFTGISGHAMLAAATYPLLLGTLAPRRWRWSALACGVLLAAALGVSRVVVHAHSVSESVAGVLVGGAASAGAWVCAWAWACAWAPPRASLPAPRLPLWAPLLAALWFMSLPAVAPPSNTHAMVTRLALALSGHERPYVRGQWRWPAPTAVAPDTSHVIAPDTSDVIAPDTAHVVAPTLAPVHRFVNPLVQRVVSRPLPAPQAPPAQPPLLLPSAPARAH